MSSLYSLKLNFLDRSAIESIHETSLRILGEVGVRIHHPDVLKLLRDAGANVDFGRSVVKMPSSMILEAIESAGKRFILYGRDGTKVARFGYGDSNQLSSGGQYAWIDPETGGRRNPTAENMRDAVILGDALENIDIVGAMALPSEVDSSVRDSYVHGEMVKHTLKPCFSWIYNGRSAKNILKIYEVLAGGRRELREKPRTMAFVEAISPLQYTREGIDILMEFAGEGLPVAFGPMAMTIATAPGTLAGTLAQENAEILAGITIAQVVNSGLPVLYWGIPHVMDPLTGNISFGSPEQGIMAVAIAEVARFYGFPSGLNVGMGDSLQLDSQNGVERGITLLMGMLAGADTFGHLGICGADQGASVLQLIVDDEMVGYIKRILRGMEVSEETLAYDVIRQVGIGGNFVTEEHTLKHYRSELFFGNLFSRKSWDQWEREGRRTLLDRARDRYREILSEHRVPPLPAEIAREIDMIVESVESGA